MMGSGPSAAPAEIRQWMGQRLFDAVPVSVAVLDREYRIVLANPQFARVFGPWQGKRCYEAYKGRSARCTHCPAEGAFARGQVQTREEEGRRRDGSPARYLVQVFPIRDDRGEIPYCVELATDITHLRALEQQCVEAERLAAMGETVAGLAHAIKNIITGLEGGLYVLRSGVARGDPGRQAQGLDMLERNVGRIASLTRGLLEFARGRDLDFAWTDPVALARDAVALYRDAAATRGIVLDLEVAAPLAPAPLCAEEMADCLGNLISNALDACQLSDRPDARVRVAVRERDGALVFEVSDNGVGMDAEVKKKAFTTFFTTKTGVRTERGTGLGLLQVRKIASAHGGLVEMESEPGQGATFRVVLPRDRLPRIPAPPPPGAGGDASDGEPVPETRSPTAGGRDADEPVGTGSAGRRSEP